MAQFRRRLDQPFTIFFSEKAAAKFAAVDLDVVLRPFANALGGQLVSAVDSGAEPPGTELKRFRSIFGGAPGLPPDPGIDSAQAFKATSGKEFR